jgi:hypothetical protein
VNTRRLAADPPATVPPVSPLLVLLVVLGAAAVAIGILVLLRRRDGGWWTDPGRAAGVLGAARSPFAVILAFVILVAFQGFNAARDGAQQEASSTRTLYKTASLLPANVRDELHANILCYARATVFLDWPAMGRGGSSARVDDLAATIDDSLREVRAPDAMESAAVADIFDEANNRERGRDARLAEANGRLPEPVWIVILLGGAAVLTYVLLFADPRERFVSQAVMVGSVTVIIIGGMVLAYFLSHPYRDQAGSLQPSAMRHTLAEIQKDPHFAEGPALHRCDVRGEPLPVG